MPIRYLDDNPSDLLVEFSVEDFDQLCNGTQFGEYSVDVPGVGAHLYRYGDPLSPHRRPHGVPVPLKDHELDRWYSNKRLTVEAGGTRFHLQLV